MTPPRLISFKLCPFVQRSVITLNAKAVDFKIDYIELDNKPDWFLALSPLGRVPILQVEDTVLFESAVINEYLDEVYSPRFHPEDPLRKAQNRAWIEFGSALLGDQYQLMHSADADDYARRSAVIAAKLAQLEAQLSAGPYFNGADFSLVDAAYAPLLMRFAIAEQHGLPALLQGKVRAWSEALLARPDVQKSVVPEFSALYLEMLKKLSPYAAEQLR
ncbi:MAG: glutathione S-transferase family protein [Candidatus Sericytochromatia bacterium]